MNKTQVTIYHNPRCSKSRQTLKLLQDTNAQLQVIEYLKTPPDTRTLTNILKWLNIPARELMRQQEAPYKQLNLDDETLSEQTLIAAMHANPILIERPIVVLNQQYAAIGRPPELVLTLLEQYA